MYGERERGGRRLSAEYYYMGRYDFNGFYVLCVILLRHLTVYIQILIE